MKLRLLCATMGVLPFLFAGAATAATSTTTTTFNVTANVPSTCKVSATTLAFGTYTPGSGAVTGNSTISVNCTKGTAFTVALNDGSSGSSASYTNRNMTGTDTTNKSDLLNYQLYTTATVGSGGTVWGDGSSGSSTSTVAGTGAGMGIPQAIAETVYGQIPDTATNEAAVPGAYSDTVTVTVSY